MKQVTNLFYRKTRGRNSMKLWRAGAHHTGKADYCREILDRDISYPLFKE